jgi:7-cyano-7-deazaguanine synthase
VLLSGGIDSATALQLMSEDYLVRAITFEYHGVARSELRAARAISSQAGVKEHRFVRVPDLREAADIPGAVFTGLPPTYIPLRNAVFYSLAASYAEEVGACAIVGGHNKDDSMVFQDVRPGFFRPLEKAILAGSSILRARRLRIVRPLRLKTKAEVIHLADEIGVPLELTWSCHRDGKKHCWNCPGCLSRLRSFAEAGVKDPLAGKGENYLRGRPAV